MPSTRHQHLDTAENARTIAPTLVGASGIWIIVLAGFFMTVHEDPAPFHTTDVGVIIAADNEPLELGVLREASEVEPQQQLGKQ